MFHSGILRETFCFRPARINRDFHKSLHACLLSYENSHTGKTVWSDYFLKELMPIFRAVKRIFRSQDKRKLVPPPPILQIMMLKLSPPRCVISKESVQQKWIDELWFRKQISTCLFVWTLEYNDLVHLLIFAIVSS